MNPTTCRHWWLCGKDRYEGDIKLAHGICKYCLAEREFEIDTSVVFARENVYGTADRPVRERLGVR